MTQELDKNGRPKIYCANCGNRMNYTYTQQWFGCSGYKYHGYWQTKEAGHWYTSYEEAEVRLRELQALDYRNREYDSIGNGAVSYTHLTLPTKA